MGSQPHLLALDDDEDELPGILEENGHLVETGVLGGGFSTLRRRRTFDVSLVGRRLSDGPGPELVRKLGRLSSETERILTTGHAPRVRSSQVIPEGGQVFHTQGGKTNVRQKASPVAIAGYLERRAGGHSEALPMMCHGPARRRSRAERRTGLLGTL